MVRDCRAIAMDSAETRSGCKGWFSFGVDSTTKDKPFRHIETLLFKK